MLGIFLCAATALIADVKLPAIISDHMVLQRTKHVPIWGSATPGEDITVTLNGQSTHATANADGKWRAELDLAHSPAGPFDLVVSGKQSITVHDVLVGEVWLASGQSNMEFTLKHSIGAEEEIALPENQQLREFHVANKTSPVPLDDCVGHWMTSNPKTRGDFSAVGYFFSKKLQHDLQRPVGVIHSSWGATPAEAWTSRASLDTVPALAHSTQKHIDEARDFAAARPRYLADLTAWLKDNKREDYAPGDIHTYADPGISTDGWIPVRVDMPVAAPGLPFTGTIWLRREWDFTADEVHLHVAGKKDLGLDFGDVIGFESVYWNGEKIGATPPEKYPGLRHAHTYAVPVAKLRAGSNVLAVRVFAPITSPAFVFDPMHPPAALTGDWTAKAEYAFDELKSSDRASVPEPPWNPWPPQKFGAYNYNGMIAPLIPYALRGAIWYQGEGNVSRAFQYRTTFPLLIEDWRKQWGRGDFPFYFCQIANFHDKSVTPGESDTAELREAQHLTLRLPNTGEAVLIDIGESKDIHPRNKKDAGERLARIALARDYGKAVAYSGPVYDSMQIEGNKIRLRFKHADEGLTAATLPSVYDVETLLHLTAPRVRNSPKSQLEGFVICGADHKWTWAEAKIEGGSAVVWSDTVSKPVAVRYGWADNPTCNLANGAGLPASPFRTDDFPAVTGNVVDW
jgi:sialate O-acetylesterase